MADSVAKHILRALHASSKPMSSRELYDALDTIESHSAAGTICSQLYAADRISRTGEPGKFAYAITQAGVAWLSKKDERAPKKRALGTKAASKNKTIAKSSGTKKAKSARTNQAAAPNTLIAKLATHPALRSAVTSMQALATTPAREIAQVGVLLEARPDEERMRLAAHVIALWPTPIEQIPPDLQRRLYESFSAFGPEA